MDSERKAVSHVPVTETTAKRSLRRRLSCTSALLLFVVLLIGYSSPWMNQEYSVRWQFRLHRQKFEEIVARVKAVQIPAGTQRSLLVDPSFDVKTLRRLTTDLDNQTDSAVGKICVYRHESGEYQVTIVLEDEGHFGMYGLMYSDGPVEVHNAGDWYGVVGGGLLIVDGGKIDKHWHYAYNNSF